jgi:predicted CopG family antitoxin
MTTKNVRLDEETYELVEAKKRDDETFSEAIARLIGGPPLLDLAGILSDEEAEEMREAVERSREAWSERQAELIDRFDETG